MMGRALWALCFVATVVWTPPTLAADWQIDHGKSKLAFIATWEDIPFEGIFHRFDAKLHFDANRLAGSAFDVTVDVTSADTNSADQNEGMAEREWFDYLQFPAATFVTSEIRPMAEQRYEAEGTLTVKGVRKRIVLPFTWTQSAGQARMAGEVIVKRTDFNIGTGEWATDPSIGFDVKVSVDLWLTKY